MMRQTWLSVIIPLLCVAGRVRAEPEASVALGLSASPCAAKVVELPELERLLKIELPTSMDTASAEKGSLVLDCGTERDELIVSFERNRTHWQIRVALDSLPVELRARTLALATAEQLRTTPEASAEPTPPPPVPPLRPTPVLTPTPLTPAPPLAAVPPNVVEKTTRRPRMLRLTRDLSIGLGAATVGFLGVGIPLAVVGYSPSKLLNHEALGITGATFVSAGVITLTGTIVSLVLWARERRRAIATAPDR